MARLIEIKGLGADVASVKKGIGELRNAAAGLNTESTALKAELGELTDQIKQHRADLRFEAETLGNGNGSESDGQSEKPKPPSAPLVVTTEAGEVASSDSSAGSFRASPGNNP